MLEQLISLISHYGMLGIFVSMLIENIGIPLPTEGAFLVGMHLVNQGQHSFWAMYWYIVASHMVGAVIAYWLGRAFERRLVSRFASSKKFTAAKMAIDKWYDRFGSVTVLATRVIGYVRPWSSLIAGMAKFPFWPFAFWSFVGTLIFVYPTMKVSAILVTLWNRYPITHILISVGILVGMLAVLFIYWLGRRPQDGVVTKDSSLSDKS